MSHDRSESSGEGGESNHLSEGFLVGGGRYTLLRQIGQGGMGVVWLAHDERLSDPVALKFLPSAVRDDAADLARLRQETQKSRKLTHPNILRIYDLYEAPGEPAFISMEYVNGPNLWELRTRQPNGVFVWKDLQPLVKQLCDALEYAHGERVIHRDLKPTNLMLAANGRLKLADFGLAAVAMQVDPGSVERRFGGGTLTHMSPQQLAGEIAAVTDDIYALGATLYDLLCGQPPFYEGDLRHQLQYQPAPPLQERLAALKIANDVPPEVAAIIMACLAKEPSKRPQSASAVAEWIDSVEKESPPAPKPASTIYAVPAANPSEEEEPSPSRKSWLPIVLLAGLGCIGLAFWLKRTPPPPSPSIRAITTQSNPVVAVNETPVEAPQSNAPPAPTPPPVVAAQSQSFLDTTFDAGRGPAGEINDLAIQPDGGILVAGHFNSFSGVARRGLVRLRDNGKLDYQVADIYGTIDAIAIQSGGRILIAGDFNAVNGMTRPRVARLEPNLALDPLFYTGEGPDGEVFSVLTDNDHIFITGAFQHIGEANLAGVARLDASGAVDPSFKPGAGADGPVLAAVVVEKNKLLIGGKFFHYHGQGRDYMCGILQSGAPSGVFRRDVKGGPVRVIVNQPDGKILIAGEFDALHNAKLNGIARLKPGGNVDPSFKPGSGVDRTIETMAVQNDGKIIIGGDFNSVDGVPREHLARLNPDGSLDTTFFPKIVGEKVRKVLVQRDGGILVAGEFTSVDGVSRAKLARLKPYPSSVPLLSTPAPNLVAPSQSLLDSAFDPGGGAGGEIFDLASEPNGGILVAGNFKSFGGLPRRGFVRLLGNGKLDSTRIALDGPVDSIAARKDGRILIAGDFKTVNGVKRNRVALLQDNLALDPSFDVGDGPDGEVLTVVADDDNNTFLGGVFTHIGGADFSRVARLTVNGNPDSTFQIGAGVDGPVLAAVVFQQDKILIGGDFAHFHDDDGYEGRLCEIFHGGKFSGFHHSIKGGPVRDILTQPDGKILIAGQFRGVDDASLGGIARLDPSGMIDPDFHPGLGADRIVETVALQGDGKIILGGEFTTFDSVPRNGLARLNTDGSLDASFFPKIIGKEVRKVLVQRDGGILIAGQFTSVEGVSRVNLARLKPDQSIR